MRNWQEHKLRSIHAEHIDRIREKEKLLHRKESKRGEDPLHWLSRYLRHRK